MAQLLLIGNNFAVLRGGDKGYNVGDVVHARPDGVSRSSGETPEKGYVSIEIPGFSVKDAIEIYSQPKIAPLITVKELPPIGRRKLSIDFNSTSIPTHPAANKYAKSFALKAGRGIAKHLEADETVKLRAVVKVLR
jgi:hypothetical protein